MKREIILKALILALALSLVAIQTDALDYPHSGINNINCESCHYVYGTEPTLMLPWLEYGVDIDDTQYNSLCWSCHNPAYGAPYVRTHSSLQIDNDYGNWTVECRVCHNPHAQRQFKTYGSESYLYSGISTDIQIDQPEAGKSELTKTGAGWTINEYQGLVVIPNINEDSYGYKILSNTDSTLTIEGQIDLSRVTPGVDTFAVIYGKLIYDIVRLDRIIDPLTPKTGDKEVKFLNSTGANSFADGDTTYDGICEVCHTETTHFRNDGTGPEQLHLNVGGAGGAYCIQCHPHNNGFAHGGGAGGGTGCVECHGHDAGTNFDPDMSTPYTPGTTASQGRGTYQSHSTHTETDSDDQRGPGIYCNTCHDINKFPFFKTGTDIDGDGNYNLAETDVCDTCHSTGGTYDGVNDPDLGAKYGNNGELKYNWSNRIYEEDGTLKAGNEKWCATCHDESPSQIQSVDAPNVIGNEDGTYTYGTGWGFYRTGHGLSSGDSYPASGGVTAGAGKTCLDCHDSTLSHIDGDTRTFDDGGSSTLDPGYYRLGYRLKQVGGQEPMLVPWPENTNNSADNYRLCAGCHTIVPAFTDVNDLTSTNLVTTGSDGTKNRHAYHLTQNVLRYPADWSGADTSRMTCVVCHNVHGSTKLAMVRDGKLTGREPGLMIWYNNDDIVIYNTSYPDPPDPENLPLSASTGTVWRGNTAGNLCTHCHGSDNTIPEYRTPYQNIEQAPTLDWTGDINFTSDGINPDTGPGKSDFEFRVKYTDTNNDIPVFIEVWVDMNDDGDYNDSGEKQSMTGSNATDNNYVDGKSYKKTISLSKAGDNTLRYRFYASDGAAATGPPTFDSTVTITNNVPDLAWTGESYYLSDGVNPDTGADGDSFEFRIDYTDLDNEAPTSIQVWIDRNDDSDYLDANEKEDMTEVAAGDTTYSDGKLYTTTLNIAYAGDGALNYRFYATEGIADATGSPTSGNLLTVSSSSNNPPSLDWLIESCRTDGVKPATGAAGGDFVFRVTYTDMDNVCPPAASDIQVWVDENDNSIYEAGEKYNLTEDDASDTTCSDGKNYNVTLQLALAGDNTLNYRFSASDGTDPATGDPTSDSALIVVDALKVRTTGGTGWYSSIQSAIDAVNGAHTILVYEGTYNEDLDLDGANDDFTTIQSVCGADSTIINGSTNVVEFQFDNIGSVLDGFSVTGGVVGINLNTASPTIQNCKIYGNNNSAGSGGGIYSTGSITGITILNSDIYSNSALNGAGIYFNQGIHTITNSTIRNNSSTSGGGIFFNWTGTGTTVTNTTIRDNTATGAGAGLHFNGGISDFSKCTIIGNIASGTGGAMYLTNAATTANFENCIIADNDGTQGGAMYVNEGTTSIINTTIADNQATAGSGGAFYLNCAGTTVRNSIFWSNGATGSGNNIYKGGCGPYTITITDSDITTSAAYILDPAKGGLWTISNNIDPAQDPDFVGLGDYHIRSSSSALDQANATYAPADDIDGDSRPQGSGDDMGADEWAPGYNAPVLSWTGEANYTTDGVDPDSDNSGSSFVFRVDYTDADNDAPVFMQLWIDEDANGAYGEGEKYTMTEVDSGDTVYTDGKRYTKTLALSCVGGCTLNYRFYAYDGLAEATGTPVSDSIVEVTNNAPVLSWTGEANYTSDGVNPDSASGGSNFGFRIDYTDADNTAPVAIEVWVDEDDSGTYSSGEKYAMTEVDSGDTVYTDGKRYTLTLPLNKAGDGSLNYRFYASDGTDDAVGTPTANKTVTVTNNAPTLAWTGELNFTTDGVNPDSANSGSIFEFRIDYSDPDNEAPAVIQIWIDRNDDGDYLDAGEQENMTEVDAGDTVYTDGKRYSKSLNLDYAGDGILNYRFYSSDGTALAIGTPTSNSTVTVVLIPNNAPTLAWTGETNYTIDGVDPDSEASGSSFTFRIDYTDADNDAPASIQVWIDRNDDGDYLDTSEQENMTEVDVVDTVYTDGKRYTATLNIDFAGDGILNYRFYASDGTDDATGTPTLNSTLTVLDPLEVPLEYSTFLLPTNIKTKSLFLPWFYFFQVL